MLETEVPTRAEIAEMLKSISPRKGKKSEKRVRNMSRRNRVKDTVPDPVFKKIDSDLASYLEWEIEVDDPDD